MAFNDFFFFYLSNFFHRNFFQEILATFPVDIEKKKKKKRKSFVGGSKKSP